MLVRCLSCETECPATDRFCRACGSGLPRHCAACGTAAAFGARFCGQCGSTLDPSSKPDEDARPVERRQITTLFVDLVGSTRLSEQVDPEDYRDAVKRYHALCSDRIEREGGFVAQLLGDGVLAYFGYPVAAEDDAVRAVLAARSLVNAVDALPPISIGGSDHRLQARAAVHTGLAVVDPDEGAGRPKAFGEPLNLAAQLQSLAEPGGVVISEATRRLVADQVRTRPIGSVPSKGLERTVVVHAVERERAGRAAGEIRVTFAAGSFINRERETDLLRRRARSAADGRPEVVVLIGEPGIGKSRLAQHLRETDEVPLRWLEGRCKPYEQDTALRPISAIARRLLGDADEELPIEERLDRRLQHLDISDPYAAGQIAASLDLGPAEVADLRPAVASRRRHQVMSLIASWFAAECRDNPTAIVLEDTQWADASTRTMLSVLTERLTDEPTFVLLTARTGSDVSWLGAAAATMVDLRPLADSDAFQLVRAETGEARLRDSVTRSIVARGEGNPLFLQELTRSAIDLTQTGGPSGAQSPAIPSTLRDALMARLDRLGPSKRIAQTAAVIGRDFDRSVLVDVAGGSAEPVDRALRELLTAEILSTGGNGDSSAYHFRHALLRDIAYDSVVRSDRRTLHARAAAALERHESELVARQPEALAHHLSEAGDAVRASSLWVEAARRAVRRSAYEEAITLLSHASTDARQSDDPPLRARLLLDAAVTRAAPLLALKGWSAAEVEQNYADAEAIAGSLGDTRASLAATRGLFNVAMLRGALDDADRLAALLREAAVQSGDDLALASVRPLSVTHFFAGRFADATAPLGDAVALYDRERHGQLAHVHGIDPGVAGRAIDAWHACLTGDLARMRDRRDSAIELARSISHPFSLAYAFALASSVEQSRGAPAEALAAAEAGRAVAMANDYSYWIAWTEIVQGWAHARLGCSASGIAMLRSGIDGYEATGAQLILPYARALLAEAMIAGGEPAEAIACARAALDTAPAESVTFHRAYAERVLGDACSAAGDWVAADQAYRSGLAVGADQGACLPVAQIRAAWASSLSRRGRHREAAAMVTSAMAEIERLLPPDEVQRLLQALRPT